MPIRFKTSELSFGMPIYLKSDTGQFMHQLVGIELVPAGEKSGEYDKVAVKFVLSYQGDISRVYDFECTLEPGESMIDPADDDD